MSDVNHVPAKLPTNRSFGLLFVFVFALVGAWSLWQRGASYPWWLAVSVILLFATFLAPSTLTPLNKAWMKLGEILGRIVSPIVLGLMFYFLITPFGVVKRLTGWDPMRRKYDPGLPSYWIERDPPGPPPGSLPNQY